MYDSVFLTAYQYLTSPTGSTLLKCILVLFLAYFSWRLIIYLYVAAASSGIHYVNFKRQALQLVPSNNPFLCEVDYNTASYSGIKCILRSQYECYVQAFWGVPISALFDLLHGDWQSLINAVLTHIPSEKFSSKCICSNDMFILSAGEEKSIEFKPNLLIGNENIFSQEAKYMREIYPFVLLMVLKEENISESSVIAMANAVHVPDKSLSLYSQLIGQYTKLLSGHVGLVKKVFLSSPATSDDEGDASDLCLICYHRPVCMVFLPCRHACLCSVCFEQCDRCPVCRSASPCYFELCDIQR